MDKTISIMCVFTGLDEDDKFCPLDSTYILAVSSNYRSTDKHFLSKILAFRNSFIMKQNSLCRVDLDSSAYFLH